MCDLCLKWGKVEEAKVVARILRLSDKQILLLFEKVDIKFEKVDQFDPADMPEEMRDGGKDSMYMSILLSEAGSKENLLNQLKSLE